MALIKMLHFLALASGLGFGMAGLVIMRTSAGAAAEAMPAIGEIRMRLGQLAGLSILVLWVTGIWMWLSLHDGAIGIWFALKVLLVIGLTAISGYLNLTIFRASRGGPRPDPVQMARLGQAATGLAVLIVVLAVLAFGT